MRDANGRPAEPDALECGALAPLSDFVPNPKRRQGAALQSALGASKSGQLLVRAHVRKTVNFPNIFDGMSGGLKTCV